MDIRQFFFRNRSYTPIPLAVAILYFADKEGSFLFYGMALVIIGELLRMNGVRYAGGATRTRNVGAKTLCTSGPFAYLRNPLYLGNIIIYSGVVFIAGGAHVVSMMIVTIIFFAVQYGMIISLEEKTLFRLFGDQYEEYEGAVPRMIPRLTRWTGGNKTQPSPWGKTLRTEKRTLQTILGVLILILVKQYTFS